VCVLFEGRDLTKSCLRPAKLCFDAAYPLSIRLSVYQGDDWVHWEISRTALGDAYLHPVDLDGSDISLQFVPDHEALIICLHPPGGHMCYALNSAKVYDYLAWTHGIVAPCRTGGRDCYDPRCVECVRVSADLCADLAFPTI